MNREHDAVAPPFDSRSGGGGEKETNTPEPAQFDPYPEAMKIYEMVVEFLKQRGELRRPSEIATEEELDDHFDDLASVYKRTLLFLGLEWPPPAAGLPPEND